MIQTDSRVSLHRSDNIFGVLEHKDDDVSIELSISTLARILSRFPLHYKLESAPPKVTQFNPWVEIVCESGQPVRLKTQLGIHGSFVNVFIQPDGNGASTTNI